MKETNISALIRMEAAKYGCMLWRNNVGMLFNKDGVPIHYGLCKGSSDLIGIYKGRFVAFEIKVPGKKPSKLQEWFIHIIKKHGGIAAVLTSVDDLKKELDV